MKSEKQRLKEIENKVTYGERLSSGDGVFLYNCGDLNYIGCIADIVRRQKNGNNTYFIQNRHINYTNICKNGCLFCAFSKKSDENGAYTMNIETILNHAEKSEGGVREFHIVGGLNETLPFSYYIEMLETLKKRFPNIHIQGFTAVEIAFFSEITGFEPREILIRLRDAGLGSMPGGGAEIFSRRIRSETCPNKVDGQTWLNIVETAHNLGIKSNATMLYGHIETPEEKIEHMTALRDLNDRTGGFMSFIPLPFHPQNTRMSWINRTSVIEDLKNLAISRLMLDNFPHIKAFWIMLGKEIAQISQFYGVDDIDGTVVEERITHSAGATTEQFLTRDELITLIAQSGHIPVERDTLYNTYE